MTAPQCVCCDGWIGVGWQLRSARSLQGKTPFGVHADVCPTCLFAALQVTSDGSTERPWCSWEATGGGCPTYDSSVQQACATGLCQAAGYAAGTYISSTRDWCNEPILVNPGQQLRYIVAVTAA